MYSGRLYITFNLITLCYNAGRFYPLTVLSYCMKRRLLWYFVYSHLSLWLYSSALTQIDCQTMTHHVKLQCNKNPSCPARGIQYHCILLLLFFGGLFVCLKKSKCFSPDYWYHLATAPEEMDCHRLIISSSSNLVYKRTKQISKPVLSWNVLSVWLFNEQYGQP